MGRGGDAVTGAEWLACADPTPMLRFLTGKVSPRKERLFACDCCKIASDLMPDPRCGAAVRVAEQFADHMTDEGVLHTAWEVADRLVVQLCLTQEKGRETAILAAVLTAITCANDGSGIAYDGYQHLLRLTEPTLRTKRRAWAKDVIHCIFGNPFRPAALDPSWLAWNDGTVAKLAAAIYAERRFADLPILADALEDASCTDAAVLAPCRSGGEHVRGCWVVDLLTGRG
jgi:hypothetical protein